MATSIEFSNNTIIVSFDARGDGKIKILDPSQSVLTVGAEIVITSDKKTISEKKDRILGELYYPYNKRIDGAVTFTFGPRNAKFTTIQLTNFNSFNSLQDTKDEIYEYE